MTEYWKSQPKKFCDACKCWIADNKASLGFHENGKKHQLNVQQRLSEIRARGSAADRQAKKEETWLEKMEAAALKDYRNKDLGGGADITARIFNEKKADREAEKRAIEEVAEKARERLAEGQPGTSTSSIGPQIPFPPTKPGDISGSSGNPLRKMETPKSGTKWHRDAPASSSSTDGSGGDKESGPKSWFEALTEEGHTYFWHVETHESRWEAPPEGFLSVAEQEEINARHDAKEAKRVQKMCDSQAIHGSHREEGEEAAAVQGPAARATPYGAWQTVESRPRIQIGQLDLQTPQPREAPKTPATFPKDAPVKFTERATPSLGGASAFGGGEIGFKKRKVNGDHRKNMRRKADDDD